MMTVIEAVTKKQMPYSFTFSNTYSVRTLNAVERILRGDRIKPNTGDSCTLATALQYIYKLPVFGLHLDNRGVRLEYVNINRQAQKALTPIYQAERMAMRIREGYALGDEVPCADHLYMTFRYTRPHSELLNVRDIALESAMPLIEQAIKHLHSRKPLTIYRNQ